MDIFKRCEISFQHLFELFTVFFDDFLNDGAEKVFGQVHIAFEIHIGDFRFNHPELREVAPSLGLFGPEGRPEAIGLAKSHRSRFLIELAGLAEISRRIKIGGAKKSTGALGRVGCENRRVDQNEVSIIKIVANRLNQGMANADDQMLAFGAQPEVTVIHQKCVTVSLFGDGVVYRL